MTNCTHDYYGFVLKPAEGEEPWSAFQQEKGSAKNNGLRLKYSQMSALESESKWDAGLTSDSVGGHHSPQMLVNPKFCLFARHHGFYFVPSPTLPEAAAHADHFFNSLLHLTRLSLSSARLLTVHRWDKERLLVLLDSCLAPKCQSGL